MMNRRESVVAVWCIVSLSRSFPVWPGERHNLLSGYYLPEPARLAGATSSRNTSVINSTAKFDVLFHRQKVFYFLFYPMFHSQCLATGSHPESIKSNTQTCVLFKDWALLGYYAVCSGNYLPTFRDNL